jgi:anti-sigma factor RsiW
MIKPCDPVTDADLDAYIDDQLDVGRRIEVEAHLSALPDIAARVMSDLRMRDELRLAIASSKGMVRPATSDAARRLEHGLARARIVGTLQHAAAVVVLIAAGWLAHAASGSLSVTEVVASTAPPAYVDDAVRAHRTSMLRAAMASQLELPDYDQAEIRSATAIVMPTLPDGWKVKDVQIYPSQFGPSVEMAVETEDFRIVSLFAVRPGTFDVVEPTSVKSDDVVAAYFQIGEVAYALVASADVHHLDQAAERLAATLY